MAGGVPQGIPFTAVVRYAEANELTQSELLFLDARIQELDEVFREVWMSKMKKPGGAS